MTRIATLTALLCVAGSVFASGASAQLFRRPVACDSCIAGWYYFDETPGGGVSDWSCASSSYDGHRGSDFSLRGGNGAIATGYDVVAGAAGTVVSTQDGHYDRCTACGGAMCGLDFGFGFGNHVVINHGSYRVVYAHMRTGSLRVGPGDTVTCGQTLGQIASSGCSTGAHLHFETRPLGGASSTAFDPFAGPCSATSPSRWVSQGAHRAMPAPTCDGPAPPMCPSGTFPIWTCIDGSTRRRRCIDGVDMVESCAYGCRSMPVGTDDVCAPPPDADGDGSRADVDCDDGNASIHPGAVDTCGDGVDQDCSGADAICPGVDAGPPVDAGSVDAGPRADAAGSDGAVPRADGGEPGADGGVVGLDASRPDRDGALSGGCGCRAAGATPPRALALLLTGLCGLFWRRRSSHRTNGRPTRRSASPLEGSAPSGT